jgi:hypothetical protein
MRRLLLFIALLVLTAKASASHAFVACSGTCTNSNTSASSLIVPSTGTLTFTATHFLWLGIRAGHGVTINTPTSSPSETWTCGATVDPGVGLSTVTGCWANNITGGSYTVTVTTSGTTNLHIAIDEYSGTPTTCSPIQGSQSTNSVTATNTITSTGITTTGTTSILTATGVGNNATSWSATTGTQQASLVSGRIGTADRLNVGAGTTTQQETIGGANTDLSIIAIAIIQTCPTATPNMPPVVLTFTPNWRWLLYWVTR